MRKFLALALVLALASVAGLGYVGSYLQGGRNELGCTETVLQGDVEAARGLSIQMNTLYDDRLLWRTSMAPGSADQAQTEFQFLNSRYQWEDFGDSLELYIPSTDFGISGSGGLDLDERDFDMLTEPALDVASRAPDGETYTERVRLADYYQYYPIYLRIDRQDSGSWTIAAVSQEDGTVYYQGKVEITDLLPFRIPVDRDTVVEVTIEKGKDGVVYDINSSSNGGAYVNAESVFTEDGVFVYMEARISRSTIVEPGQGSEQEAQEVYEEEILPLGLYYIPLEGEQIDLDTFEIRQVYQVDQGREGLDLQRSGDGKDLLFFTREGEELVMSVLDGGTAEEKQRLILGRQEGDSGFAQLDTVVQEDLVVTAANNGQIFVVCPQVDGSYQVNMASRLNSEAAYYYQGIRGNLAPQGVAYDGERLALLAGDSYHYSWEDPAFYLVVCTADGVEYASAFSDTHSSNPYDAYSYQILDLVLTVD